MSDPAKSVGDIDDVLSSIRRLVAEQPGSVSRADQAPPAPREPNEKLVLTPALRVPETVGIGPDGDAGTFTAGEATMPPPDEERSEEIAGALPDEASAPEVQKAATRDAAPEADDHRAESHAEDGITVDLQSAETEEGRPEPSNEPTTEAFVADVLAEAEDGGSRIQAPVGLTGDAMPDEAQESSGPQGDGDGDEPTAPELPRNGDVADDCPTGNTSDDEAGPPEPDAIVGGKGWRSDIKLLDWDTGAPDTASDSVGEFEPDTGDADWPDAGANRALLDLAAVREAASSGSEPAAGQGREAGVSDFTPIFSRRSDDLDPVRETDEDAAASVADRTVAPRAAQANVADDKGAGSAAVVEVSSSEVADGSADEIEQGSADTAALEDAAEPAAIEASGARDAVMEDAAPDETSTDEPVAADASDDTGAASGPHVGHDVGHDVGHAALETDQSSAAAGSEIGDWTDEADANAFAAGFGAGAEPPEGDPPAGPDVGRNDARAEVETQADGEAVVGELDEPEPARADGDAEAPVFEGVNEAAQRLATEIAAATSASPSFRADDPDADEDRGDASESPATDLTAGEEGDLLDEETLRRIVAEVVRQELQGALGERITRNVRKLVRREIRLVLAADELD